GATWTPGPTTTTWNAVVNEETIFYCEVTCAGSGITNSTPVTVQLSPENQCYCEAVRSNDCDEFIGDVYFGTIVNENNGCPSAPGYQDFRYLSTTLQQGGSYPITVVNGGSVYSDNQVY